MEESERPGLVLEQRAADVVLCARGQVAVQGFNKLDGHKGRVGAHELAQGGLDARLVVAEAEAREGMAAAQRACGDASANGAQPVAVEVEVRQRVVV